MMKLQYTCSLFVYNKKSAVAIAKKLGKLGMVSTGHHFPGIGLFTRIVVYSDVTKRVVEKHYKRKMEWFEVEVENLDNVIEP